MRGPHQLRRLPDPDGPPAMLTCSNEISIEKKDENKYQSNEPGLNDRVMEEECRALLESKVCACALPKNVEFLEERTVLRF